MKLNNQKLAEIMVKAGFNEDTALETATSLFENEETVMFRAILWGYAKFGKKATHNTDFIRTIMDNGRLNEFQALAKISMQELQPQ